MGNSSKNFYLDTNVLLHDPDCIRKLGQNKIYVPIVVLEEVDSFKKEQGALGWASRQVNREIDKLRILAEEQGSSLSKGVKLDNGATLVVDSSESDSLRPHPALASNKVDNIILMMARDLQERTGEPVIVISKDCNVRIKADSLGLKAEDYEESNVDDTFLYEKVRKIEIDSYQLSRLFESLNNEDGDGFKITDEDLDISISTNEHVGLYLIDSEDCVYVRKLADNRLKIIEAHDHRKVFGIKPKNTEQRLAMDLLMDQDIKFVSLIGKSGVGKTLIALAAALQQVIEERIYKKVIIIRPAVSVGKDLGFLPGTKREKLAAWLGPIQDNLDIILPEADANMKGNKGIESLESFGYMEVESLQHIRGRSIQNAIIIADEIQNSTPLDIKTLITRLGNNSKVVLCGDPWQIDLSYVDTQSNGLSYATERLKGKDITGTVNFFKSERSAISELAADHL